MEWGTGLWLIAVGAAILAVVVGLVGASRRRSQTVSKPSEPAPIYTSGVFSLIRKSPRESVSARIPALEAVRAVLAAAPASTRAAGTAEAYREEWVRMANLCISNIEHGDQQGIQTYRYVVPEKCCVTCGRFGGDAYVTRDQLHHQSLLIPPFHLGCGCEITPREAWQGGTGGWSPILPVNGQYDTPDWRSVVPL